MIDYQYLLLVLKDRYETLAEEREIEEPSIEAETLEDIVYSWKLIMGFENGLHRYYFSTGKHVATLLAEDIMSFKRGFNWFRRLNHEYEIIEKKLEEAKEKLLKGEIVNE